MTDREIRERMEKHWKKALELYPKDRIVGLFLQGSQNYYMEDEESDVDTKLLIVPSLEDIVLNKQPVSTTHILDNDEHMDAKDVRLYWQTMRKGNINFVELLFARVQIVNPMYADLWDEVTGLREQIARVNPRNAIKAMMGMVNEKYFAMTHRYPSRVDIIDEFGGYDPKQLHHLIRVTHFLEGYVTHDWSYRELILMQNISVSQRQAIKSIKRNGYHSLEYAKEIAEEFKTLAEDIYHKWENYWDGTDNPWTLAAMNDLMTKIVKQSIKKELEE